MDYHLTSCTTSTFQLRPDMSHLICVEFDWDFIESSKWYSTSSQQEMVFLLNCLEHILDFCVNTFHSISDCSRKGSSRGCCRQSYDRKRILANLHGRSRQDANQQSSHCCTGRRNKGRQVPNTLFSGPCISLQRLFTGFKLLIQVSSRGLTLNVVEEEFHKEISRKSER